MEYTDKDYARLYGEKPEPVLTLRQMVILAIWAVILGSCTGCDAADAEVTAALEREAHSRKAVHPSAIFDHERKPCDATLRLSVGGVVDHEECYRRAPGAWL